MSEFQYLSDEDAKQILDQGKISPETYQAILDKAKQTKLAPEVTPLSWRTGTHPREEPLTPEEEKEVELGVGEDLAKLKEVDMKNKQVALGEEQKTEMRQQTGAEAKKYFNFIPEAQATEITGGIAGQTQQAEEQPKTETFNPLDPYAKQIGAIQKQADIVSKQAMEDAAQYHQARLATQKIENDQIELSNRHATRIQNEMNTLDQMKEDYSKTNIDPSHFWSDMTTGNKILSGIALALGAIGGSVDGRNRAVDIFENAINRDINVQKANLEKKAQTMQMQRSVLADMRTQFNDENSAVAATKAIALDRLKMQIEENALQVKSPLAQAQAQGLLAEVELKRDNAIMEFARARQMSPQLTNASLADREILAKVPMQERDKAYVEKEKLDAFNTDKAKLSAIIERMHNKPITSLVGEQLTGRNYDEAAFMQVGGKYFKGDPARAAKFEKEIKPYLGGFVFKGSLQKKLDSFNEAFDSFKPETPLFSQYGVQTRASTRTEEPVTQDTRFERKVNK